MESNWRCQVAQTTSNGNKNEKASNRPAHTIRYGAVRAAIWRNIVDNGNASRPLYCVTFSRSYKDGENHWKENASFATDDLLVLAKAADEAHTWITRQRSVDCSTEK
jgi:hypothetical protein